MTIRYTPNAAGLSWLALSDTIDSRATMEKALFSLLGANTKTSIQLTQSQASNAKAALDAQADQTQMQGAMAMIGAAASALVTVGCTTMQMRNAGKARDLDLGTEREVNFEEVPAQPHIAGQPEAIEMRSLSSSSSSSSSSSPVSARVTASNDNAPNQARSNGRAANNNRPENNQSEENKNLQQDYNNRAQWWLTNENNFSNLASTFFSSGLSNLLTVQDIRDQGTAKAAEALAGGIGQVINTQGGIFTSSLQGCDSFMQNTNSTVAAIIGASRA